MTTKVRIFLTKRALSEGILMIDEAEKSGYGGGYSFYRVGKSVKEYVSKKNVYFTYADAAARAEIVRTKKIESLRKQISKLENLSFKESHKDSGTN